jgi:hypothetical protein
MIGQRARLLGSRHPLGNARVEEGLASLWCVERLEAVDGPTTKRLFRRGELLDKEAECARTSGFADQFKQPATQTGIRFTAEVHHEFVEVFCYEWKQSVETILAKLRVVLPHQCEALFVASRCALLLRHNGSSAQRTRFQQRRPSEREGGVCCKPELAGRAPLAHGKSRCSHDE